MAVGVGVAAAGRGGDGDGEGVATSVGRVSRRAPTTTMEARSVTATAIEGGRTVLR
jgi:hypothetical protein